ncbi:MAG: hypothetical protein IPO83_16075 [Chitinophagaceae bacterium]|nr:hypothetical protein [Chitinophagaceae bacterium]
MKKKLLLFFSVCMHAMATLAGNEPQSIGAKTNAMGGAGITLADPFSIFNNQAAMAFVKDISVGIFSERRFMMSELGYNAGGVILPTKSGVFGVSVSYSGFDVYNEKKAGLSYARLFSKKISGSIQFDYLGTSIAEYGNGSTFTFEAGLLVKITDKFSTGAHVFNPVRVNSGFIDEKAPTVLKLGISYEASDKVWLAAEAKKDIDQAVQLCAGLEYRVIDALHLRAGFGTNPALYTFGAGINVAQLKIDMAATYHQVLGVSPQLSISYAFVKKK